MKYYRIIGFAVAGALSLSGFALLGQAEKLEVNRDYKIQTLSGDANVLNGIGLETVIKSGKNTFEKVLMTNEKVDFTKTSYDLYRGVAEDVLENREMYRNLYYPAVLENEDYLMTAQVASGYPYSSDVPLLTLNIKDNKTGTLKQYEQILDVASGGYINNEVLYEYNGTYYYVVSSSNWNARVSKATIYTLEPKTGKFEKYYEYQAEDFYNLKLVDGKMITNIYDKDSQKLVVIDIESKNINTISFEDNEAISYIGSMYSSNDNYFIESELGLYHFDLDKLEFTTSNATKPNVLEELDGYTTWYYINDLLYQDNKAYVLYQINSDNGAGYQVLHVFDVNTGETLYEGKIASRSDQGIVTGFELVEVK